MPSDSRLELAMRALAAPIEAYRSAVAAAAEEVRGFLATHRSTADAGDAAIELGPFAAGRIDLEAFSRIGPGAAAVEPGTLAEIDAALDVLRRAATPREDAFRVVVEPGRRLGDAVGAALAEAGRVAAAARFAAAARRGGAPAARGNGRPGAGLPFPEWSEGERRFAPPLAVELDGADLRAGDLVEFLDGGVKIVLVVRPPCAPAPLVRLITPGALVVQTADETDLERVADAAGPAVAALVPEDAARFIHDPAAGPEPWSRLTLRHLPERSAKRPVGAASVRQQTDELEQLRALAARPDAAPAAPRDGAATPPERSDPADRLAAWLLSQAELSDLA